MHWWLTLSPTHQLLLLKSIIVLGSKVEPQWSKSRRFHRSTLTCSLRLKVSLDCFGFSCSTQIFLNE